MITTTPEDVKKFDTLIQSIGSKQVLPNSGKFLTIQNISSTLKMDIRKVRILVDENIDGGKLRFEFPAKVTQKNKDVSRLIKIILPEKKNTLPYNNLNFR